MTDETNQSATGKKPSHVAYYVRDTADGKGFFTRIGAAWPNKNGTGYNIQLDVIPLNGRISLCLPSERND